MQTIISDSYKYFYTRFDFCYIPQRPDNLSYPDVRGLEGQKYNKVKTLHSKMNNLTVKPYKINIDALGGAAVADPIDRSAGMDIDPATEIKIE